MDKEDRYIYTIENHSAIKKNEIFPFATPWVDIKSIVLKKINKSEKQMSCDSFICGI